MRHRRRNKRFNRTRSHRTALGRHVVGSLFLHGRVVTTVEKAKEFRRMAERLVTIAKRGPKSLHSYRRVISILQDKAVAKKLFTEIAPQFVSRNGGYTRITRLPHNRLGDNASQAVFELVLPVQKAEPTAAPEEKQKAASPKGGKAAPKSEKAAPKKKSASGSK